MSQESQDLCRDIMKVLNPGQSEPVPHPGPKPTATAGSHVQAWHDRAERYGNYLLSKEVLDDNEKKFLAEAAADALKQMGW